jgi:DNA (cytosine-5)-methyltransferase 3A
MKILSLFDGISCARVALERAGIPVEAYYASEIDKYAIQISQKNYPDIKQVGSVTNVTGFYSEALPSKTDLLIGGSPCQDLSIAKKDRKGLDGERSGLFWEYVRILREVNPKYFILENVASMPKEAKEIITRELGVEPIMINASLVSAQNRKRLFWTNIPNVTLPEDRGILLKDILEENIAGEYDVNACSFRGRYLVDGKRRDVLGAKTEQRLEIGGNKANTITTVYKDSMVRIGQIGKGGQGDRIYSPQGKSVALSALGGGRGAKTGLYQTEEYTVRKLTPIECERLQGLPDNYTEGVSNTQRYKCLGNAFNVDVVSWILSFIPKM